MSGRHILEVDNIFWIDQQELGGVRLLCVYWSNPNAIVLFLLLAHILKWIFYGEYMYMQSYRIWISKLQCRFLINWKSTAARRIHWRLHFACGTKCTFFNSAIAQPLSAAARRTSIVDYIPLKAQNVPSFSRFHHSPIFIFSKFDVSRHLHSSFRQLS
jgi:hypothetical protein